MFDRVHAPLIGALFLGRARPPEALESPDIPIEFSFASDVIDQEIGYKQGVLAHGAEYAAEVECYAGRGIDYAEAEENYRILAERCVEEQYRWNGIMGTWCASERGLFFKRFSEGQVIAYQGALNNLPIVGTDIGWEEVKSFRKDAQAVRKYRDLKLWLTDGLHAQSEQHATDIVAQRIEDYRWAIKKHGLRTATGTLANLWDWKQSVALAAGVGAATTFGSAVVGALVAGLAITSGIGAYFTERKISAKDVRLGEGREVAILVDMQDRFGTP